MLALGLRTYFRRQGALRRLDTLRPAVRRHVEGFALPEANAPLDSIRFVVFDCETTGLDPRKDRMLSIGAVALAGGALRIADSFEAYVLADDVGGREAGAIHGLVPQELRAGGRREDVVVDEFLDYVGDAVLVGHHVAFDLSLIETSLRWSRQPPLLHASVDTETLARRLDTGPLPNHARVAHKRYRLDDLAERFELPTVERHTAAGDALVTGMVLQRLLREARGRGIETIGDLIG